MSEYYDYGDETYEVQYYGYSPSDLFVGSKYFFNYFTFGKMYLDL